MAIYFVSDFALFFISLMVEFLEPVQNLMDRSSSKFQDW